MKHRRFAAALLCGTMFCGLPQPAKADPISAAILTVVGIEATATAVAVTTFAIGLAASATLGYVTRLFTSTPTTQASSVSSTPGTQLNVQFGATVPRDRIFGYQATAGQFAYWNLSGQDNAYLDIVYNVGDGPHDSIAGIIANGNVCNLGTPDGIGTPVIEFNAEDGTPRLWVKFFQGFEDQAADPRLVATANPAGRWTENDKLSGIAYVRVTTLYDEKVFQGGSLPSLVYIIKGALLYDARKDSTNGGSGSHRWTDQHSWEWSDNVSVGLYNYQRGLYLNGELILGEGLAPFDLITDMYVAAANACDENVTLKDGSAEKRYRIAMNVGADQEHRDVIQGFLDAMAGQMLEQVGSFGPVAGVDQTVMLPAISDTDLIVGKQVTFSSKRSRADLLNAVFGSYTEPNQQYGMIPYPPRTSSADEISDGERLASQVDYPQIQSGTQAQRVGEITRRLSRAQGTANITVGFRWAVAEPGDWVPWNSARYPELTWRVDGYTINEDETVTLQLREISVAVYAWDDDVDQLDPTTPGDLPGFGDLPTTVSGFTLAGTQIFGADGLVIPALRCLWSPTTDRSITQVIVQYRVKTDDDSGVIKQAPPFVRPDSGGDLITEGIQANTIYEARATIVTIPARVTIYTDWVEQLAPPLHVVPVSNKTLLAEYAALSAEIKNLVDTVIPGQFADNDKRVARLATTVQQALSRTAINKVIIRDDIVSASDRASAEIDIVRTTAVTAEEAVASLETTVSARFDALNAAVTEQAIAIATIDGYAATKWSVIADVNGNVAGIVLFNDSDSHSSFTVTADTFGVAFPGMTGGTRVPVFTIANVGGVAKLALRGDMIIDGSIITQMIAAGAITAVTIQAGAVNTTQLAVNSVDINVLIAGAATQFTYNAYAGHGTGFSGTLTAGSISMTVKSGVAYFTCMGSFSCTSTTGVTLKVDGSPYKVWSFGAGSLDLPLCMLVIGLSSASHTFSLDYTFGGTGSGTFGPGVLYVQDLRR